MSNPIDAAVGERIRQLRKERQFTQTELADAVGLTFQQIQKYEKARNRISASKLVQIADILGVEISELFTGIHSPEPECMDERELLMSCFKKMRPDVRAHFLGLLLAISNDG